LFDKHIFMLYISRFNVQQKTIDINHSVPHDTNRGIHET
jgi:hypothetical protein